MKLKTLKNFNTKGHLKDKDFRNEFDRGVAYGEVYIIQILKIEAIKWVKEFEKMGGKPAIEIFKDEKIAENNPNGKQYFKDENELWLTSKIVFIINFFNLTEEDLK